jgi:uncharacterized delta-60 repeat protein
MKTLKRCSSIYRLPRAAWRCFLLASLAFIAASMWADPGPSVLGGLKRELYLNVPGLSVAELTNHARFPDNPDVVDLVASFETPTQQGDFYGERLTGYIHPPLTGMYVFYLASDDQGILFLSPDEDPANKQPIAWESEWNMPRHWANPQPPDPAPTSISPPIALEVGRRYYVEALHKEGGGGDNFGVAWQIPGGTVPEVGNPPIGGEFLATPGTNQAPLVAMVSPAQGAVFQPGADVLLTASATDVDGGVQTLVFFANATPLGIQRGKGPNQTGTYSLVWSNVPAGNFALTALATDYAGMSTTSAPVHIKVTASGSEKELHLVGVYSGNVNGHSSRTNEEGIVRVTVNRPGKRVTLLLGAYEPVLWSVTVGSETILEKVILAGYYPKRIEGIPLGVPVVHLWYNSTTPYFSFGYSIESCEFYRALPKVIALTGMQPSSFRGAYTAPIEPYVIDSVQNDPRLSPAWPEPANLAELPSLQFEVPFSTATSPGSSGQVYRKSYTLAGIQGGGSLLPDMRVVADLSGRYFYAARSHEVMRIDAQTGYVESMPVTAGEVSWPMGMAYDSARNRVLLVTLGGEGFLYAYYPATAQWKLVRSMDNLDVGNLVYHPAQDALYAVGQHWGDYGPWTLYRFSPEGVRQGEIELPHTCLAGAEYGFDSELISVGQYLVLLVAPEHMSYYSDAAETRMYLIDPRSGQVWLTSRQGVGNQCPTVEISSPAQNSTFTVGQPIPITARVTDPDSHVHPVDFYANGEKLGRANAYSTATFQWTNAPIGSYALTTVATDQGWCSATSAPVRITVNQLNTPPTVACPPPQSVTATTETGLAAYVTLTATVTDPDYGPLRALWYVDGSVVATNNLPADPTHPRTAVFSAMFMLGLHSVKVEVSDSIAPPTSCTTTVEVISPVARVFPARDDQQSPRAASDGTNFFVVWLDRRNKAGTDWTQCDVYGARVSSNGYVLDRNGILIASNSMWASPPAIGFDGTNYLVAWQDNPDGQSGPIRGTRVSRNGVVLDGPNGFRISEDTGLLQSNPALAFDGRLWFVAWNDWRNQTNGIPDNLICDIYGARVTPRGEVLDPVNIPVVRTPYWQTSPAVASLGQDFMVIWKDMGGIRGARVADSGAVSASFLVSAGRLGDVGSPALARLGSSYLAAWDESFAVGNNIVHAWIIGTRLTPSGGVLDPNGLLIRTNQARSLRVAITPWQSQAMVAWDESSPTNDAASRVWGTFVSPAGNFAAAHLLTPHPSTQTQMTLASNNRALFSAWHDMRNATNNAYNPWPWGDIYGTVFNLTVTPIEPPIIIGPTDFLISSETLNPAIVIWTTPAPITYGTFLGPAQLNATSSVPGSFSYVPPAGTLLHAGSSQRLIAVFTPSDLTRYFRVTNTVFIDVLPAPLTINANNKVRRVNTPNPPLTASYSGLVAGDSPEVLDIPPTLTTTATVDSPPGDYPIVVSGAADADYTITFVNGILQVTPGTTGPGSLDLAIQAQFDGWLMIHNVAKQPDGKILVAGWFRTGGDVLRTNLARLNPDGTVDPTFDAARAAMHEVFSAVPLPGGKILIGTPQAPVDIGFSELGLLRLNTDGSVDYTFRPGASEEDWGGVRSITLQPDGKILIGGMFGIGARNVLARLNSDGSLDNSFDAGEIYVWEGDDYVVRDLLLKADGRVLVRGDISDVQGQEINGCFCLLPNGLLDPDFLILDGWTSALALQADGKILIGGAPHLDVPPGLYRFHANGHRDGSFAQEGSGWIVPSALAVQPDGKIIVAGEPAIAITGPWGLYAGNEVVRLGADGVPDSTFNSGIGADGHVSRLLLLPQHVLVAGSFKRFDGVERNGLAWLHNEVAVPGSFVERRISGFSVQLSATPPAGTLVWAVEDSPPPNWAVLDISNDGVWDANTGKVKFGPFFDAEPRTLSYRVVPPLGFVGIGLFSGYASANGQSSVVSGDNRIVITTEHPADRSPSDWKLTMDEATGYAAAWRGGQEWPTPPNPIPVDYVTRASALWRGGETYRLDPSVEGPPLWWVNTEVPPVRQDGEPLPLEAFRRVPPLYVPGESLEAAIHITTSPVFRAYAVEEQVPEGWGARAISDGGQVDSVNRLIKWGPFHDATARTLRYTLVPPATARGRVALAGSASFDGALVRIAGCNMLYCSSRLTWNPRQTQPGWALQLRGGIGERYVVERSTDLRNWTPLITVTNSLGSVELPNVEQPASGNCYYRARLLSGN